MARICADTLETFPVAFFWGSQRPDRQLQKQGHHDDAARDARFFCRAEVEGRAVVSRPRSFRDVKGNHIVLGQCQPICFIKVVRRPQEIRRIQSSAPCTFQKATSQVTRKLFVLDDRACPRIRTRGKSSTSRAIGHPYEAFDDVFPLPDSLTADSAEAVMR